MRVHESHYTGRAIIIFRNFFQSTQIRVIKNIRVFPSVVFHAHVKGESERSELTPCNYEAYTLDNHLYTNHVSGDTYHKF